jgi:hypothetical protein
LIQAEYRELCREISLALNAENPEALYEYRRVQVGEDVEAMMYFNEDLDANVVFCYVDLGEIPEEKRVEVYQNLLELNLLTGSKTNAVFAVDPASGRAILVAHFPAVRKPDAAAIVKKLRLYALQATSMRGTFLAGSIDSVRQQNQPAQQPMADRI